MYHSPEEQRMTLRRVLRRANYETSEMQAAEGDSHQAESVIIRRIEAATIPTKNYPASRRQSPVSAALATWENEGGSVRASKQKTKRNDNLTERNGDGPHLPQ
jgi:hypothetical protein